MCGIGFQSQGKTNQQTQHHTKRKQEREEKNKKKTRVMMSEMFTLWQPTRSEIEQAEEVISFGKNERKKITCLGNV